VTCAITITTTIIIKKSVAISFRTKDPFTSRASRYS
jgi:hypothetical protein